MEKYMTMEEIINEIIEYATPSNIKGEMNETSLSVALGSYRVQF